MSQVISPSTFLPVSTGNTSTKSNSFEDLGTGDFLELMIAELQNQDPLEPADNSQLLQQISQIREISSSDSLVNALSSIKTGQDVATASQLIGKKVTALSKQNEEVEGIVDRVTMAAGAGDGPRELLVHVGNFEIPLDNIREIIPEN